MLSWLCHLLYAKQELLSRRFHCTRYIPLSLFCLSPNCLLCAHAYHCHVVCLVNCSTLPTLLVTRSWFCLCLRSMSSMVDHMLETSLLCRYVPKLKSTYNFYRVISMAWNLCFTSTGIHDPSYWCFILQGGHEDGCWSVSQLEGHSLIIPSHFLAGCFAKFDNLHICYIVQSVIKKKYGQDATNVGDEGGFAPNIQVWP
jgi:hypothetical protein